MSLHEDVAINPWVRYLNAYAHSREWIKGFPAGWSAAFLSGPVKPASGPSRHLEWAQQSDRVQVKADIKWQAGSVANGSVAMTCS
jgi:hypothetical protein